MLLELESAPGELLSRRNLAQDIRRLWAMGNFEDIRVEVERVASGVVLAYIVKERPTVRKIIVEGNAKIKLDDINEVLDLKLNSILDLAPSRPTSRRSSPPTSRRASSSPRSPTA